MSSAAPTSSKQAQDNALIPTIFLIGVTALLVFFAVPRPYHDPAETPVPTEAANTVAAANTSSAEPTPEDHLVLMSLGLEEVSESSVKTGQRLFSTICAACHGADAKGMPGLGKPLVNSAFVNQLNDDQLVAFITQGRPTTDPANTTGVAMPAKGGNPSLTDADLNAIVDYIRSLNGATVIHDGGEPTPVPTVRPFKPIDLGGGSSSSNTTTESTPEPTVSVPSTDATPVTTYGFETQGGQSTDATPVTTYGFETQGQATAEATTQP